MAAILDFEKPIIEIQEKIEELKKMTNQEADQVFDVVVQKIMERGQFDTKPKGIDGLTILVQSRPELRKSLVNFIDAIPAAKVGVWILHGWDRAIPKNCDERKILNQYIDKLKSNGTLVVKAALKKMRGD